MRLENVVFPDTGHPAGTPFHGPSPDTVQMPDDASVCWKKQKAGLERQRLKEDTLRPEKQRLPGRATTED